MRHLTQAFTERRRKSEGGKSFGKLQLHVFNFSEESFCKETDLSPDLDLGRGVCISSVYSSWSWGR
jgi:hypothetical protein